jgi:hypothetical protein
MGQAGYRKVNREYEAKKTTKMLEKRILELLKIKGMKIPEKIFKRYEKIHQFPSPKEIDDFEREYNQRLTDCFGRPNVIEIFIGRYIVFNPTMLRFLRSIKLTGLRNFTRKLRGKR